MVDFHRCCSLLLFGRRVAALRRGFSLVGHWIVIRRSLIRFQRSSDIDSAKSESRESARKLVDVGRKHLKNLQKPGNFPHTGDEARRGYRGTDKTRAARDHTHSIETVVKYS